MALRTLSLTSRLRGRWSDLGRVLAMPAGQQLVQHQAPSIHLRVRALHMQRPQWQQAQVRFCQRMYVPARQNSVVCDTKLDEPSPLTGAASWPGRSIGYDKEIGEYVRCGQPFTDATNHEAACQYHEISFFGTVGSTVARTMISRLPVARAGLT
ncbi:uncharacterized protein MONBRDRAFT_36662 [Monosiga brevicollis MX1]|uniref:Uncharacterized protein n=1 Tax=Monosiga brevicollis TaxID=81824 RepID=A9UWQ4_MONBE|nr:uncharacterized protein MONBRDRAFT_36662 [Monosiga brevicollis MX1]EDQ90255.1 predicted protein [Monosiga brevicollis MX1]|eukprot:XP_001745022.1 hypothetical protein [Monosiga brevicollis MX1]